MMVHSAIFWTHMVEFFCLSILDRTWVSIKLISCLRRISYLFAHRHATEMLIALEALGNLLQNHRYNKIISRNNRRLLFLQTCMSITKMLHGETKH